MKDKKELYIATLVGCALGDTLGMPVEGWKPEQIRKYAGKITEPLAPQIPRDELGQIIREDEYGRLPGFTRNLSRGEYTDDTILTLAIAESIAGYGRLSLEKIAEAQLRAGAARQNAEEGAGRLRLAAPREAEGEAHLRRA